MFVVLNGQSKTDSPHVTATLRVALVCMPFASALRPSIQIALTTALAEKAGCTADAFHFNLDLAAQLTPDLYEQLCEHRGRMTGEWLFGVAAFGSDTNSSDDSYFQQFPEEAAWAQKIGKDREFLIDLRRRVLPAFVDKLLDEVPWDSYRAVGFSSTFQQNVASLALARRIKERFPSTAIIFGGANMEAEMGPEYARAFPFIDYVISGEADVAFPALLQCLASGEPPRQVPGLISRTSEGVHSAGQAPPVHNLDDSPVPKYQPYFERADQLGLFPHYQFKWSVPFESSRGCWWGQKQHCTFCGLNGLGMTFRSKSPQRVLDELSEQMRRHRINSFEAVDNILDTKYLSSFFGEIEKNKLDFQFFYEVKSNLTREHIRALYRGGVRCIQPGIESLSSHVLRLMRKGCTMLQNVRTLKWCHYYGVRVGWNLLWGFPGETEDDYRNQLGILKSIGHLEPPKCSTRIWLERFSPYFTERGAFPIRNIRPEASYRHVYPAHVETDRIAYFFDYDMEETVPEEVHARTDEYVAQWQKTWDSDARHTLRYRRTSDGILIDFKRGAESAGTWSLSGALALLYEFCGETMHTAEQAAEHLLNSPGQYRIDVQDIRETFDEFCHAGLMAGEDGKYLSLAIPANPNW